MKRFFKKDNQVRRPVPIEPAEKFYDGEPLPRRLAAFVRQLAHNAGRLINSTIVLLIIVFLSVFVGTRAFPVLQLNTFTLRAIMDAVSKPFPEVRLLLSTLFASLVTVFIYLPEELPNSDGDHSTARRYTRLLAGLVIVVVFDSWFLDIDLPVLLQTGKIDISALAQPLIAQGFAFLAVFMGLLLLRRLISFGSIRFEGIPSSLRKTWNWARFLVVSLGLTVFGGWFTAWSLSPYAESLEVIRLPKSFLGIEEVSPPLLTAMAVSTTVAVLTFRPPGYRDIETRLITWRLVLLIAAGGLTLWTYRLFGSADQFFLFAGTAFGLTIALTFAQRALS